jgi:two-component system, response regulator PdtaR
MNPKRLFIADDDPIIRRDLRETLERMGYNVIGEAGDGIQALRLVRRLEPDLILLDLRMPGLDGLQVAEAIARAELAPVVLITAYADTTIIQRSQDAQVYAFLTKPFRESDLQAAIETAGAQFTRILRLKEEARGLRADAEARKLIGRAKSILMRRLGLNESEAFHRLQTRSLDTGRTLREVADAIVVSSRLDVTDPTSNVKRQASEVNRPSSSAIPELSQLTPDV